ncbi:hypothetical protein ACFQ0B_03870 [Nonomuraea thailandensis]
MTASGRRHLERLDKLIESLQDDLLAPLTGPEREQFSALLARLLAHHSRR